MHGFHSFATGGGFAPSATGPDDREYEGLKRQRQTVAQLRQEVAAFVLLDAKRPLDSDEVDDLQALTAELAAEETTLREFLDEMGMCR